MAVNEILRIEGPFFTTLQSPNLWFHERLASKEFLFESGITITSLISTNIMLKTTSNQIPSFIATAKISFSHSAATSKILKKLL